MILMVRVCTDYMFLLTKMMDAKATHSSINGQKTKK